MHGFLTAAQPYLVALIGIIAPALTLLYARRDKPDTDKKAAGQQFIDNIVKDNTDLRAYNNDLQGQVDSWRARAEKAEAALSDRDKTLADHGTNAPEMFSMMAVPGAMKMLRDHRDKHTLTMS